MYTINENTLINGVNIGAVIFIENWSLKNWINRIKF